MSFFLLHVEWSASDFFYVEAQTEVSVGLKYKYLSQGLSFSRESCFNSWVDDHIHLATDIIVGKKGAGI